MLILLWAGMLALAPSLHAAAPPLALQEVEAEVLAKHPGLQAYRHAEEGARAMARAEGAWDDPQVSYEWMQLRWPDPVLSDAGRRRLELSQAIPLFGQAYSRGRAAAHGADRAGAQTRMEAARLVFEAKRAYWMAQEADQLLKAQARTQQALASLRKVSAQRGRFGRLDRMGQLMDAMLERELASDEAMGLQWRG
jgi:outer membrane protein TolC